MREKRTEEKQIQTGEVVGCCCKAMGAMGDSCCVCSFLVDFIKDVNDLRVLFGRSAHVEHIPRPSTWNGGKRKCALFTWKDLVRSYVMKRVGLLRSDCPSPNPLGLSEDRSRHGAGLFPANFR